MGVAAIAARLEGVRTVASFTPVAALSTENVNVIWTSELAGTVIDPTSPLLQVKMAFPVSSGLILRPAEPVTWYTAGWLTGTTIAGFVAQCLVGPSGGVVTLSAGVTYDVWSQILGTPENPVKFAGQLAVY